MILKPKKKILVFIDWFVPGYKAGGPIRSVENIANGLKEVADFYICTSNTDFGVAEPYEAITFNEWTRFSEHIKVMYLTPDKANISNYQLIIDSEVFDTFYVNSIFSPNFAIKPLLALKRKNKLIQTIVAPRGMLGEGALKLKSTKKQVFLFASKILGIFKNVTWHASSNKEIVEIKNIFGIKETIVVAPNLPKQATTIPLNIEKIEGKLKLFFLSRISEKKNLVGALKLLQAVSNNMSIEFSIFGPKEDANYWNECQSEIAKLPVNIIVKYEGVLKPDEIASIINQHHFMLLPTFNENYGHVFIESFLAGKPIIISDQTPWNGLVSKNVGWDIPLTNTSKFVEVIEKCVQMGQVEYYELSEKSFQYGKMISEDKVVLQKNIDLFTQF